MHTCTSDGVLGLGGGSPSRFFSSSLLVRKGGNKKTSETDELLTAFPNWYRGLSFEKRMCFVLDVYPSQLTRKYWQLTFEDLSVATDLKVGQEMARLTQNYESLIKVVSKALGGEEKKQKPTVMQNAEHAKQAFAQLFGPA